MASERLDDAQDLAKEQERKIVAEARAGGADTYSFNPDAPPEVKAAEVKRTIPPGLVPSTQEPPAAAVSVPTDEVQPLANGSDSKALNGASKSSLTVPPTPSTPATGLATVPATPKYVNGFPKAGDGEWGRTGWEPRFGDLNEALRLVDATSDHQTFVAANLDDKFFGDWYHNAGIIVFSCLSTWLITKLGGGLAWIILIMAGCATYYRTSIMRVRRNVKDDLTREFAKQKLETDVESLEWINSFLVKFWPIYQPVMAATIINVVDGILAGSTPGFLDSIRLTTFTLGTKPPRLEHVKTYPKTDEDVVEMDWKFTFTPNDTADLTSRQLKNKVNPKVVLEIRVGKGIASKGIPIVVEDMSFSGLMKIKMKLQIPFPHINKIDVCFLDKPIFDFVLKPLGGETFGIDIGFLPGLSGFIQDQVHANLGPMFYAPNIFTLDVAGMMGGAPVDQAIGVLQLTIHRAQGLKNTDKFSGEPDPYIVCSIDNGKEITRTKVVHENANPRWNETKHVLITSYNGSLTLALFDFNDFRKDKELGVASFDLKALETDPEHENLTLPIMSGLKQRGQVICDVKFFPVLEGVKLEDGTLQPPPESNTGIVRFTVTQAKDLDSSKSMIGQLSPYAVMLVNNKPIHTTKILKRKNDPVWSEFQEIIVGNRSKCQLGLQIKDDRGLAADPLLGSINYKLETLLEMMEKGNDWINLSHAKSGKVQIKVQWRPVALKGALGGSGGYITPIGVARIHFKSAKNLRNLEKVGKSDPYARVLLNGIEKGKTVVFDNDLNPEWDEVLYIPVHTPREKLTLEVMDSENLGKDRSLGMYELSLDEFVKEGPNGTYLEHSEKIDRSEGLMLAKKGTPKGVLNFTVAFYPCLNIADADDEDNKKESTEDSPNDLEKPTSVPMQAEKSSSGETTDSSTTDEDDKGPQKVKLTTEELLSYNSGLLIFKLIEGQFAKTDTHIDIVMDDMLYPAYSSSKIKSKNVKLEEISDAVVRELDFSKVTIRLRESSKDKEHDEDDIVAKLTGQTQQTLRKCLNAPQTFTLKHNNGDTSKITISLKYIPILMTLDPSESINNMGTLRVDLMDAANLPAADRSGKSDPFCVFELNDEKVFKSKVQKKTLHPVWNEYFETKVPSRTAADFIMKVYDWDLAGDADFLGQAKLDLSSLEPFQPKLTVVKLTGKNGVSGDFGEVRLRFLFKSDYVVRSRQGSSTFSGTFAVPGKIVTGVAGAPIKGVGLAASGIGKGASFLKRGVFGKNKSVELVAEEQEIEAAVANGGGIRATGDGSLQTVDSYNTPQISLDSSAEVHMEQDPSAAEKASLSADRHHRRSKSGASVKSTSPARPNTSGSIDQGVATIRLVSASGFPAANLRGRIRLLGGKNKEILKSRSQKSSTGDATWDETCTVTCTPDQQFKLIVEDDHTFIDKVLGEGMFVVDDTGTGKDTVVRVGEGHVVLRTSFAMNGTSEAGTTGSPRRRGFLGKGKA